MTAPGRFAAWMSTYAREDKFGHLYRYHPRSDRHSVQLCTFIQEDILERCPVLREQAMRGEVACGINLPHTWPNGKTKTIDFAVGRSVDPRQRSPEIGTKRKARLADVLISCEAKSVMTEHGKSMPRVFDELSSSHEIVHHGRTDAIAAGITVVNIAKTFVSPTRNQRVGSELVISKHNQPHVTERMVEHLRGLLVRERVDDPGFDAYCTIVIDCDNQGDCDLWSASPAPKPGDPDHYDTFIARLVRFYTDRFGSR